MVTKAGFSRSICVILCVSLVALLCLVTKIYITSAEDLSAGSVYKKPLPSLPVTLDPKSYVDAYSIMVASQIYDRLIDTDELLYLKPKLAENWETKDDGQKWIINLRKDVLFQNGKPLTAEDVIFSLSRLIEKDSVRYNELSSVRGAKEYHDGKTKKVDGLKILNDHSIEIDLVQPFPPFISVLASANTEIVPSGFAGKSAEQFFMAPIGTGAFKFEKDEKGKFIELIANDKYFLGKPKLSKIIFEKASKESAIKGFNTGTYQDVEWFFPQPNEITRDYNVIKMPRASTSSIVFNTKNAPLNNIHIRKAIAYALDKSKLLKTCYSDRTPANGYIPPGLGGYYQDIGAYSYDVEKAKSELSKSKEPPTITKKTLTLLRPDNYPCKDEFTRLLSENLKKIGMSVNVVHLPLDVLISQYYWGKKYDMLHITYPADFPEALFMLNTFRSNNTENPSGIKLPEIDKLLTSASSISDRYKRYEIYKQIQEIIQQNIPVIPLYYDVFSSVYQTNVRGIKRTPLASYMTPMWPIEIVEEKK